ncbi:hypothetical protein BH10PLA1_BH10PLA1_01380 [soil metagenome]
MSMDRSLRGASSLVRHRNVLTRAERLDRLAEVDKWDASKPVLGLPKVANRKQALAKAEKTDAVDGAAPAAGGAAPAAGAKGAAPAAGAKAAAPAAGAKGAAPAAKAAAPAAKKK